VLLFRHQGILNKNRKLAVKIVYLELYIIVMRTSRIFYREAAVLLSLLRRWIGSMTKAKAQVQYSVQENSVL